MPKTKKNF